VDIKLPHQSNQYVVNG
jgi:hypothetical protein